jgi:pyruvate,water dikinase
MIRGNDGLTALRPNSELMSMARQARDLPPEVRELMQSGRFSEAKSACSASEEGRRLLGRFEEFLERFGFLSATGSDFTAVPWAEDPRPVWQSLGRFARLAETGTSGNGGESDWKAPLFVRSRLNPFRRLILDRLWNSTRRYMEIREDVSLIMSEETFIMRRVLLALAGGLVRQGELENASDIFLLYHDELRDRLAGSLSVEEARRRIAMRREEMSRDAGVEIPETFSGEPCRFWPLAADPEDFLNGISGSPGRARGTARIVLDPSRIPGSLTAEDILVVPFTDVGWTPLLPGIRGIVAETGGQLSHTSIIAREYGLPAVVSVKEATRLIREGEMITIDGSLGRVYRHPPAPAGLQGES